MASGTSPTTARKQARDRAAQLLDAEDAERRRQEAARRRRVTEHAGEVAGNDAEIEQLTAKIGDIRADSTRRLAALVADGVSEEQVAAMTGRDAREVRAAVNAEAKASAAGKAPAAKKTAPAQTAADNPAAA